MEGSIVDVRAFLFPARFIDTDNRLMDFSHRCPNSLPNPSSFATCTRGVVSRLIPWTLSGKGTNSLPQMGRNVMRHNEIADELCRTDSGIEYEVACHSYRNFGTRKEDDERNHWRLG